MRTASVLLALAALAGGCGGPDGPGAAGAGGSPVGMWALDREALLAEVRRKAGPLGPEAVAREEDNARSVDLQMEVRGDGRYGVRTSFQTKEQHEQGTWRQDGEVLYFRPLQKDGQRLEGAEEQRVVLRDGRIVIHFVEQDFTLVRR